MDTGAASPSPPMVAGLSPPWQLGERSTRKTGSGNIFSNVNLCQLKRLFKAAGDQDAEQRAQLVWDHGDEAELAQALIGLRARGHRRVLRSNGREALGSHWLRAFNHLRIEESSRSSHGTSPEEDSDSELGAHSSAESHQQTSPGNTGECAEPTAVFTEDRSPAETPERTVQVSSGLRRGGETDPERYLHRVIR